MVDSNNIKRKRRSVVWKSFQELDENKAQCQMCLKIVGINGHTNNMLTHLKKDHPKVLAKDKLIKNQSNEEITTSLAMLIFEKSLPISLLEANSFKRFVAALSEDYQIPSRKYFTEIILPEFYTKSQSKLKNILQSANFVSITVDSWTSNALDSYLSVTVHFIDHNTKLQNFLLGILSFPKKHSAFNIQNKLIEVVKLWDVDNKVVSAVHDNGA